jgi:hypothetical protein
MTTFLAAALKPVVLLGVLGALLAVRHTLMRFMPEGKLKRLLLLEL